VTGLKIDQDQTAMMRMRAKVLSRALGLTRLVTKSNTVQTWKIE
jgi:hypothetical protein